MPQSSRLTATALARRCPDPTGAHGGRQENGVDVMRIDAGLDTGSVAKGESVTISSDDTAGDLTNCLASVAAQLAVRALRTMETSRLEFREQSRGGISYAPKIKKSEADIDWTHDAETVRNQISRTVTLAGRLFKDVSRGPGRTGQISPR